MSTSTHPDLRNPLMCVLPPGDPATSLGAGDGDHLRRPTRVLIVDDHALNVSLLTTHLGRLGYQVQSAASGHAALASIAADPPDVVLMDILMPDLSGLEVLRRVRENPDTSDLAVILVSGLGETSDIVEGLKLGANDYVTKPINVPILQARLASQAALKRARDALKHTAACLAEELDRQALELKMAGMVQRSILPRTPPPTDGVTTAWCYEPATEVGGDLYDVIRLPDGRTFLFLADAMGHGVQAALVASTVKATLAAFLTGADDLAGLMDRLDRAVGELFEDRFVTAAACVIDPSRRVARYVLAGHPPILMHDAGGVSLLKSGGLPLGTCAGLGYEDAEISLKPAARLLLYSDGLTEAVGPEGHQFGVPALVEALAGQPTCDPATLVAGIRRRLDEFRGQVDLADDLTLLAAHLT